MQYFNDRTEIYNNNKYLYNIINSSHIPLKYTYLIYISHIKGQQMCNTIEGNIIYGLCKYLLELELMKSYIKSKSTIERYEDEHGYEEITIIEDEEKIFNQILTKEYIEILYKMIEKNIILIRMLNIEVPVIVKIIINEFKKNNLYIFESNIGFYTNKSSIITPLHNHYNNRNFCFNFDYQIDTELNYIIQFKNLIEKSYTDYIFSLSITGLNYLLQYIENDSPLFLPFSIDEKLELMESIGIDDDITIDFVNINEDYTIIHYYVLYIDDEEYDEQEYENNIIDTSPLNIDMTNTYEGECCCCFNKGDLINIVSCNHSVLCFECINTLYLKHNNRKCPICREYY
jgi:hypothetical protein